MQAVILCGGKGTRLGELTKDKPKCMLPVAGRPFLGWILEKLGEAGFARITLCAGNNSGVIKHEYPWAEVSDEWPRELGTGGALRLAMFNGLLDDKFLVTYGDTYLPFDYAEPMRELVGRQDCDAVLTVYKEEPGNVWCGTEFAAGVFSEKRVDPPKIIEHVDYGAIAMTRKVVEGIPYNLTIPLNRVLNGYAEKGRVRVVEAHEPYHTINTPEELAATDAYMRTL